MAGDRDKDDEQKTDGDGRTDRFSLANIVLDNTRKCNSVFDTGALFSVKYFGNYLPGLFKVKTLIKAGEILHVQRHISIFF